tara:strand:- start:27 stop:464 length:438 start_codon:yes stop_codon:yes gene_type:complete
VKEKSTSIIIATLFLEKGLWKATFEKANSQSLMIAKHIFGKEPTDIEIYHFVKKNYTQLQFGKPQSFELKVKRLNPKRLQREVRKEMEKFKSRSKPESYAQEYLRKELEENKIEKQKKKSGEKEERKQKQFTQRQEKKKQKHRGR